MRTLAIALLCGAVSARAAVNDVMPTDYFAPEPGSVTLSLYGYHRQLDGPYRNGVARTDGGGNANTLALRASYAFTLAQRPSAFFVVDGTTHASAAGTLPALHGSHASGRVDARLGLVHWLVADAAETRYVAATAMAILPTGDYDRRQLLNTGENRRRYVAMLGITQGLGSWVAEGALEAAWYGRNDAYPTASGPAPLEQQGTQAATLYLRYRSVPEWQPFVGAQMNRGGRTSIAGGDYANAQASQRAMIGVMWRPRRLTQVQLRYTRDTGVETGWATHPEVALRLQQSF